MSEEPRRLNILHRRSVVSTETAWLDAVSDLLDLGGALVVSSSCTPDEITWARAEGRVYVGEHGDSLGVALVRRLPAWLERQALVSHRENELHYAIRREANILDHKHTEAEAHKIALDRVQRMHAELDALHEIAKGGRRG